MSSGTSSEGHSSYLVLLIQAKFWRAFELLGYYISRWISSDLSSHAFRKTVTVEEPFTPGQFDLYFWTPKSYHTRPSEKKYPLVLDFHAGGQTIGDPRLDIRWANHVVNELDVVVVSVGYRLAPKWPFPVAQQDGISALRYISAHAIDLGLDIDRVVLSGFSFGGTLAFTIPMLYRALQDHTPDSQEAQSAAIPSRWDPIDPACRIGNPCRILGVVSFYAAFDYTLSRTQREATNTNPKYNTPPGLSKLMDQAHLSDILNADATAIQARRRDPFLSLACSPDEHVIDYLPDHIYLLTCEWDMLQAEGQRFVKRLEGLGKRVQSRTVEKGIHLWDKLPSYLIKDPGVMKARELIPVVYQEACDNMRKALENPE